jgi:uncharacterized protein YggE
MIVLGVCTAGFGEPQLSGTPSELESYLMNLPETVLLTGESKVKVQADKVIIELSIKTENVSLEAALKSNHAIRAAVTEELNKEGISSDKITAAKFSSTPRYGLFGKKPSSYEVRNIVKIAVTDEKDFQQVAKIVDQKTEVEYQGISFKHSDEKELKKQATEQAFDEILRKKALYENKLGVNLILRNFSEGISSLQELNVDKRYWANERNSYLLSERKSASEPVVDEELTSPFGELAFTASVSAKFEVKAK